MRIPFSEPDLGSKEREYLLRAYDSGWIGGKGDFIDKFEEKFARYIGVDYAITCASGTSALLLAYHACGINAQTKVVVPDTTFIATSNMLRMFTNSIDHMPVDKDTWTLPIREVKNAFAVGVHLYGNPCDMGDVYKNKTPLIEDCAQALGSKFKGKMVGSYGLASIFSFHSAKGLTTGEGGMVCTSNKIVSERVRHLKNHCMTEPYKHDALGYNARMTNLQAAIGLAQLEQVDELCAKKQAITKYYDENLSKSYTRQKEQRNSKPVKWANAYKHSEAPKIISKMKDAGIECRPGFLGEDTIVLPCSTKLTTEDLSYVVSKANIYA